MQYIIFAGLDDNPECRGAEQILSAADSLNIAKLTAKRSVLGIMEWAHVYDCQADEIVFEADQDSASFSQIVKSLEEQE